MPEPAARSIRRHREVPERIADELRMQIVSGELGEGDSLGKEPELVARFGVSRPSLREALRILEAEGLVTVVRGVLGGVVAHRPDRRMLARTAALVLQAREAPLADVSAARTLVEPVAAREVASSRTRRSAARRLRQVIERELEVIDDPEAFGAANAEFHHTLVEATGNRTLTVMMEMLDEIVARAVTAVSQQAVGATEPVAVRRRGIRSQERLVALVEEGRADEAERHWRAHMGVVGRVMLGGSEAIVVDLMDHR